jgi:hypothetical protein
MSYDLAVWKGSRPADAKAASAEFEDRMDAMEAALEQEGQPPPATPAIRAFVEAALARYPELDEGSGDDCPWASSPLIAEAVGDLIYIPMTFSGAEYARDVLAEIAEQHGLVCYDPQIEQLLPDPGATPAGNIAASAAAALGAYLDPSETEAGRRGRLRRLFRRD